MRKINWATERERKNEQLGTVPGEKTRKGERTIQGEREREREQ